MTLFQWLVGVLYIGIIMGASWLWHEVFSDTPWTWIDALISTAIVIVPIAFGKLFLMSDD